jgi:hypothetical protein
MRLLSDNSAFSTVMGFAMLLVILTAAYAYFQIEYIPEICSSHETKHFSEVIDELVELSAKVKGSITNDESSSISIKLGGYYPDIPFFSTPPGFTGMLRSYDAEVRIQNAVGVEGEVAQVWDGSEVVWTGQSLKYTPNYIFSSGEAVWEYGIVAVGKLNYVPVDGKIIEGKTIFIPLLRANISDSSNARKEYTLSVYSGGGKGILIRDNGNPIKIVLKTSLPRNFWEEYWSEVIDPSYVSSVAYNNGAVEITLRTGTTYRLSPSNQTTPATLVVEVRDKFNNPVPNVDVTFRSSSVTFSDGVHTGNALTVKSDYRGIASVVALDVSGSSGIAVASITREDGTPFEIAFTLWKG